MFLGDRLNINQGQFACAVLQIGCTLDLNPDATCGSFVVLAIRSSVAAASRAKEV
ncbi:hypothetical protein QCM77_45680 [Bradyrhizobium sp. SSUT18]|uniref:hypothetical protein n=1 Tax=unclassified Bradyrhizobium TaxID=2631580 RepID=UPI002449D4B7|nr:MULTISPECIES: hypothetical protein [unclassified Bradyrhizobium]MDH2347106.1 hypothetical protein [Bradyrhizobium sp. SSUT77]MDH2357588.1 hypothetical protein [Bradyrhizobium sp. SSUT112]MDH2407051.1 hypothetical protein [Bradyrhizobium sp. SSUT18]